MSQQTRVHLDDGEGSTLSRFSETLETGGVVSDSAKDMEATTRPVGTKLTRFPYGPSTGGMVESVYFDILTYGEKIDSMNYDPSFKNRSIRVTGLTPREGLLRLERLNGVHSASFSTLFCDACERAAEFNIPNEVKLARVVMIELERMSSHLFVASRLTGGASQNIAHMNILLLRENLLRIIASRFGHRYFFGMNKPGGLARSIDLEGIDSDIEKISGEYEEILNTLLDSRIFIDRTDRTAIITGEDSAGPALRACGIPLDGRQFHTYYGGLNFKCVNWSGGDSLSRFIVRSHEISESAKLIRQVTSKILRVPACSEDFPSPGNCKVGGFLETPSGDASIILQFQKDVISRISLVSPSQWNLRAFSRSMKGNTFADFLFGFESLGIWISEMGDIV